MNKVKLRLAAAVVGFVSISICAAGCGGGGSQTFDFEAFREPPVSVRPWVRWWWPGNDVEDAELRREVGLLADNFFGGAEIQAFDAALDPNAPGDELERRRSFDTEEFYSHLATTLDEARAQGLKMDLSLGSGWPTGGMHVPPEKSMQILLWNEWLVKGPGEVELNLDGPGTPEFYTLVEAAAALGEPMARWMPDEARLVEVVAGKVTGGERTEAWFDLVDQVELDPASVQVLTEQVEDGDKLTWDAPEGTWRVIAFFAAPDGEFPNFNAQPDPGYVMDHFDATEVTRNLEHLAGERTGLQAYYGNPLRGLFVDSLEFKVDRFWTDNFADEFAARQGYDLAPKLPAMVVPGADNNLFDGLGLPVEAPFRFDGEDRRLQYDYQATASELFLERFAGTVRDWAAERGMFLRMQGYGSDIDVLQAAGTAHIPEAEQLYAGGADMFLKTVSSGAHLYGRNEVSAETWVWALRDHRVTPTAMKAALDKLFVAGINHVVYHGFPYRKMEGYGEAGWHPFCSPWSGDGTYSSHVAETNPFWDDLTAVNRYAARSQFVLREGQPEADLLVLYPWPGFPASFVRLADHEEPLFLGRIDEDDDTAGTSTWMDLATGLFGEADLGPQGDWLQGWWDTVRDLHGHGWSWDWVNEDALKDATLHNGRIVVGGVSYGALVLWDLEAMSPELALRLADLAGDGMPVAGIGRTPGRQPGWLEYEAGDVEVARATARLLQGPRVAWDTDGTQAVAELLAGTGVRPGIRVEPAAKALRHVRRRLGNDAQLVFFANARREPLDTVISVTGGCRDPQWLDPWSGDVRLAQAGMEDGGLALRLGAFGSRVLGCGLVVEPGTKVEESTPDTKTVIPLERWSLDVEADDVPGGSVSLSLTSLDDWRDLEPLRHSAGPGLYRAAVNLSTIGEHGRVVLDLGRVEGVAEVTWNGAAVGRMIVPPFEADVTELVTAGENEVEVILTPPLRNRLVGKGLAGDPGHVQFAGKGDALAPAGLLGPAVVRIRPELNEVEEPTPMFEALVEPPEGSVLPDGIEPCAVYRESVCSQGMLRTCAIWDAGADDWAAEPDLWAEQVFWYDRYFDLYHRMEGQQAEFLYTEPMLPGTPETVWGAPKHFQRYDGFWDSAGWTGTALQAAAARYRVTGTAADYERMLDQVEAMMFQYEATGAPGLLMRCHYSMLEEGAPDPIGHCGKALVHHAPPENWEDHYPLADEFVSRLPAYYRDGVDIDGDHWDVEAKWMGHASRDMYVRSLPGILLAYDLLGADSHADAVRAVIREEIPCTLKRMKKMRIRNLQANDEIRKAVTAYLGADRLQLEPGDIDLTALDTLYGYVMEEPHPYRMDAFDPMCPDGPPMEVDPAYDLDAADEADFMFQFLDVIMRIGGQGDTPIAWIQVPSVRGSDALFMAQWALAGHYLTGDGRFLDFLDRLVNEVAFWPVIDTMGSFRLPKWCKSHYGPSLLYPTLWNLQGRVDRKRTPGWWDRLARAIKDEVRFKELVDANDCYFGVLYDAMVDAETDPGAGAYAQDMAAMLRNTSQYPAEDPFEPRRSYNTDLLTDATPGFAMEIEELSQEDREICLEPIEVFGVTFEGRLHDENPRAVEGLPIRYRHAAPFQWQEDPFQLKKDYGDRHARIQWPMSGLTVAYWTGRMHGTIEDGAGLALAWLDTGEACRNLEE